MKTRIIKNVCLSILGLVIGQTVLLAKCTPASSDYCKDANVLCSLDELNGYSCANIEYSNPSGCAPLCPSGAVAHNTSWWAFVTNGGNICITITYNQCTVTGNGVEFGIWGDCDCGESIFCDPSCTGPGSKTACGVLKPCKTYYLFVDGCSGDVCDFTITTSGGTPPLLPPLSNIYGPTTLCKGACHVQHSFEIDSTKCDPVFQWTLDGIELDQYGNEVTNDFPDEGNFVLCGTAIIGNPASGSICDQVGPKCVTIKVGNYPKIRKDKPRWICYEDLPLIWHNQKVTDTGEYTQHFDSINCCSYDSVVWFLPLKKPKANTIFYLACRGAAYEDSFALTRVTSCQNPLEITRPNSSNIYRCDSSYYLYAAFLEDTVYFESTCADTNAYLMAKPVDRTCPVLGYRTGKFYYNWYRKNDSLKTSLSDSSKLFINESNEFCLDLTLESVLDTLTRKCVRTFCETVDELQIIPPKICPIGNYQSSSGGIYHYMVDTSKLPRDYFNIEWSLENGKVLTPKEGRDSTSIKVRWDSLAEMKSVCIRYRTNCGWSETCCLPIELLSVENHKLLESDVVIIPNPVKRSFKIKYTGSESYNSVELINVNGQSVYTWKVNAINNWLLLPQDIVPGLYYVSIRTNKYQISKKILVQ